MKKIEATKFEAADSPTASTGSCQEQLNSRGEQLNNNSSQQQLPDMLTHTPDANKGTSPDRQLADAHTPKCGRVIIIKVNMFIMTT